MKSSRYALSAPVRFSADEPARRPEYCGVLDCQTHYQGKGKPRVRGFADVVFTTSDGTVIARCAEHYLRELYRSGRGKDCDISGRNWLMSLADVQEFRAKLPDGDAA